MIKDSIYDTPYGRALLYNTKPNANKKDEENTTKDQIHCFKLKDITLADGKNPTLYTCQSDFSLASPKQDDDVVLGTIGRGCVTEVRDDEEDIKTIVVELTNWHLAGRSKVKVYSNISKFLSKIPTEDSKSKDLFRVVRKKRVFEMNIYERIEHAKELKQKAIPHFVQGEYSKALDLFSTAIYAVRMQEHSPESTNEMRADLVEIMISCSNNAASCYVKLKRWEEAEQQARNALLLIDALDGKRGQKIHLILKEGGLSDLKIFGEWRVKSYLIIARAEAEQQEYAMALARLKQALSFTRAGVGVGAKVMPGLEKQDVEIRRLIQTYGERHKLIYLKEKARAKAMFGGSPKSKIGTQTSSGENKVPEASKVQETSTSSTANDASVKERSPQESFEPIACDENNANTKDILSDDISNVNFIVSDDEKNDSSDDDEFESMPWYEEHKEALILSGLGALILAGISMIRTTRSK